MKCPKCENELKPGQLYCEKCGNEIQIVPDFEPEIEQSITETLSGLVEGMAETEPQPETEPDLELEIPQEKTVKKIKPLWIYLSVAVLSLILVITGIIIGIQAYRYNSYSYQVSQALVMGEQKNYGQAIIYLERVLSMSPQDKLSTLLLADYYCKNGQEDNAIYILQEMITWDLEPEEAYQKLIEIYAKRQEYAKINYLLQHCEDNNIITQFKQYATFEPEFSEEEGNYYEVLILKLTAPSTGVIYYTLDGSEPDEYANEYTAPIFLETGRHTVKAFFVNQYGLKSQVVMKEYRIQVTEFYEPEINLAGGYYQKPEMIEVNVPEGYDVYYTRDGTDPTYNSIPYNGPILMQLGSNYLRFIAYSESGSVSEIIDRTYELSVQTAVSMELAVNSTVEKLKEEGVILDYDGHIENANGRNLYLCEGMFSYQGQIFYLIFETYEDTQGSLYKTGTQYAVNVTTGEICKATPDAQGHYTTRKF